MIAVRPVRKSDAAELAELLNVFIARGATSSLQQPYTPERLDQTYLTGPDVFCCFVAVDDETVRIECFQTLGRANHLNADWVDIGTFSRIGGTQRGVGSALFGATRQRAVELGLTGINATIRADNEGGLAFYEKLGFVDHEVERAVPLKYGTPVDRIGKHYLLHAAEQKQSSASLEGSLA